MDLGVDCLKILFVSLFLPQQQAKHAGGRYVFELLNTLSQRHEIHLATRLEEGELPYLEALHPLCKSISTYTYGAAEKRSLLDKLRLIVNYLGFSRFANRLICQGDYDLVQVEWVETAILIRKSITPMVLDAHDVITKPAERGLSQSRGPARLLAGLRYVVTRTIERRIMRRFAAIFTLSEYDHGYLLKMAPELERKIKTVPIPAGLDISDRCFEVEKNSLLFLASYKYRRVNVDAALWFYHQVFPLVRNRIPDAKFIIAGYGPPRELTLLADSDPQVSVTGFVDDIDRLYKTSAVFVAPILTGGGIIVKVLDALAAGRPVVTTSYGNEGVAALPERDLLVADDPEAFATQVLRFLTDSELAGTVASNGRNFVRKNYGLEAVIRRIEKVYKTVVEEAETH
jgi:glycosyltransferase involved in cell wall biosynthesis